MVKCMMYEVYLNKDIKRRRRRKRKEKKKKIKRKNHPITGMPMGRISPKHLESVTTKKSEISVVTLWALA